MRGILIEEKHLFNKWWNNPWNLPVNNKTIWSIQVMESINAVKGAGIDKKLGKTLQTTTKGEWFTQNICASCCDIHHYITNIKDKKILYGCNNCIAMGQGMNFNT